MVLNSEYGDMSGAARVEPAPEGEPVSRRVRAGIGNFHRCGARYRAMGEGRQETDAIFVVDAITGIGTMPLDIEGWGLDVVIGGSQKAFMIPPGLAFISISAKAWAFAETPKRRITISI